MTPVVEQPTTVPSTHLCRYDDHDNDGDRGHSAGARDFMRSTSTRGAECRNDVGHVDATPRVVSENVSSLGAGAVEFE